MRIVHTSPPTQPIARALFDAVIEMLGGPVKLKHAKVVFRGVVATGAAECAALVGAACRREGRLRCAARVLKVRNRSARRYRRPEWARQRRTRERHSGKQRTMIGTSASALDPPGPVQRPVHIGGVVVQVLAEIRGAA